MKASTMARIERSHIFQFQAKTFAPSKFAKGMRLKPAMKRFTNTMLSAIAFRISERGRKTRGVKRRAIAKFVSGPAILIIPFSLLLK